MFHMMGELWDVTPAITDEFQTAFWPAIARWGLNVDIAMARGKNCPKITAAAKKS